VKIKRVPFSRMRMERIIEKADEYARETGKAAAPRRFAALALWSTYGDQWAAYRALIDKEYKFARIDRYDIANDLNAAAKIIAQRGSIMRKISNLFSAIVPVVKDRRPPAL
jgi:hypothetical protein